MAPSLVLIALLIALLIAVDGSLARAGPAFMYARREGCLPAAPAAHAPREGGRAQIEVFAHDVAQWTRETTVNFGTDWREAKATLRYGWTDAEATAAGWRRSPVGFSWEETMRHVGKIVVVPSAAGPLETFDMDEVVVRGVE